MDPMVARDVAATGIRRAYRSGDALFREGDPPGPVFVVRSGRVDVEVTSPSGRTVVLGVKRPGDLVGELAAILGSERSASAIAKEPVVVEVIAADDFRIALSSHGDLVATVLAKLALELRTAGSDQVRRSDGTVTQRIAGELLSQAGRALEHGRPGPPVTLELGHDDLAAWVGASREAVSRSLAELRRSGLIATGRRRITILDLDALRSHAERLVEA